MRKIAVVAGVLLGVLVISGQAFAGAEKKEEKKEYRGEYRNPVWMDNEHIICVRYTVEIKKMRFDWRFGDVTDARYKIVKKEIQFVSMDINGENEKLLKSIIRDYSEQSSKWREKVFAGVERIGTISYCPQRRLIAFGTDREDGFVINLDGKIVKVFKESVGLRWSPDGSILLYCSREPGEPFGIWIWDVAMDKSYKLIKNAMRGIWTPDGKKIIFSRKIDEQLNVFLYDIETNQETPAEWLPDGRMVATYSGVVYSLQGEYLKNPSDTTPVNAKWSFDGKHIVRGASGEGYISVVDNDGSNLKILR